MINGMLIILSEPGNAWKERIYPDFSISDYLKNQRHMLSDTT
ncbi:MAG: hypothetical protein ACLFQS_01280 [Bacteroidales bacterium]